MFLGDEDIPDNNPPMIHFRHQLIDDCALVIFHLQSSSFFDSGNGRTSFLLPRSDYSLFHFPNHCTAMTLLGIHFRHWWLRSLPAHNFCIYKAVILRRKLGSVVADLYYYDSPFLVLWVTSVMKNSLLLIMQIIKEIL